MHSRLFQLELKPVEEFLNKHRYYNSFVGSVANYISKEKSTDRKDSILWFRNLYNKYGLDIDLEKETVIFKKGFKTKYFESRFKELKEQVNKLSLEEFSSDSILAYDLSNNIEQKRSFYVDSVDNVYDTFDSFIREMREETVYYFGSVFDYHS